MRKKAIPFVLFVTIITALLPFQSVSAGEGIGVQIVNQQGEVYRGTSVYVMVFVDNHGYENKSIYIGCSFQDENGRWHDLEPLPVYIESGKWTYITFCWDIPDWAPTGYYNVTVAAWKSKECFWGFNCRMKGELARDYWYDYIKVK